MKAKKEFDYFASKYRDIHNDNVKISGGDSCFFSMYKIIEIKKQEKNHNAEKILDFGCGDGLSAKFLNLNFPSAKIFGVDVSDKSIEEADKKAISNCSFLAYDGVNIPFEEDFFDFVVVACVFHHIGKEFHLKLMKECYRVLKSGGRIYFFEHNPWNILTKKLVERCPFDKEAKLLNSTYSGNLIRTAGFLRIKKRYTIFLPRYTFFRPLFFLEKLFSFVPVGGQYYISATK